MRQFFFCFLLVLFVTYAKAQSATNPVNFIVLNDSASTLWAWQAFAESPVCLSPQEIKAAKEISNDYFCLHRFFPSRSAYNCQYVPWINKKGEKEVWINFFCGPPEDQAWKKSIISISDGGDCFFQLKVNLNTKACFDFVVNSQG